MGQRLRSLALLLVLLSAGVFLGSSLAQWWHPSPAPPSSPALDPPPARKVEGRVRVEVLNGGGVTGAARDATELLRELGFDVVFFGNAETFSRDTSVVLDRVGRLDAARAVAQGLGIGRVRSEPDSSLYVDVTVRLGAEWASAGPKEDVPPPPPPWWDLRRYLPGDESSGTPDSISD